MSVETAPRDHRSYGQILKSTALIGGSSVFSVFFGIIRAKAFALMLGPSGLGLIGLYISMLDMAQNLAGLGVQGSGVRQIAEAAGSGDEDRIARTIFVLRRISVILGVAGGLLLVAFSIPIAQFTFGDRAHAGAVAILGLALFFHLVSAGQAALIQGLRRISDLARLSVLGAFFSTIIGIPMIYVLGKEGIVPSLVLMAAMSLLVSWWYARKIQVAPVRPSASQLREEIAGLLRLGLAFMASGFLTVGAAYAVRMLLLHKVGVEAAGLYQAAWTLGGFYAGFILQAMGADFYPRLTAAANDPEKCNRLVNEQAEISMLLAAPGVIATLTFAPLIMTVFYSAEFGPAASLLRWICVGMSLRIVAWPLGFIVLAKGAQKIFFWTEVAATVVHIGLAWLLVERVGLDGAGQAFFGLYVWHSLVVYCIARRLTGFRISAANKRLGLVFLSSAGLVFASFLLLPLWPATLVGSIAVCFSSFFSLYLLLEILPLETLPPVFRRRLPKLLLTAFRRAAPQRAN